MQFNYDYLLNYCQGVLAPNMSALDYGCGKGEMVAVGRERGIDIYGVDIFYKDGRTRDNVEKLGLLGTYVKEIQNGIIDFPSDRFDMVVSNQVFEHIEDLDAVLAEIARVLVPGGTLHALFPVNETWWEGHFGVPFLHNFRSNSSWQLAYARLWHRLGLGYHHAGRDSEEWAVYVCNWIAQYTSYRSQAEITWLLCKHFEEVKFTEDAYLVHRLSKATVPGKIILQTIHSTTLGRWILRKIYHKRGGIVITARCGS